MDRWMGAWEEGGREGMDGYLLWFGEIWDLGASVEGLSIYRLLVVVGGGGFIRFFDRDKAELDT